MRVITRVKGSDGGDEYRIHLTALKKLLLQNIFSMLLCAVIAAGAGFYYAAAMVSPVYVSKFSAFIYNYDRTGSYRTTDISDVDAGKSLAIAYGEVITSQNILGVALKASGLDYSLDEATDAVTCEANEEAQIIQVEVSMPFPQDAYRMAVALCSSETQEQVEGIIKGSSMEVIDQPLFPTRNKNDKTQKMILFGGAIGFALSFAAALARNILGKKTEDPEEKQEGKE